MALDYRKCAEEIFSHLGGKENIIYHYVGSVIPAHEAFVREHQLGDHVIFHGKQSGEPLTELLKQSFIGIDVLGGHRKDYPVSSSLKSREYCALLRMTLRW